MSYLGGERIRGIEAPLPPGEQVRWEGRPRAGALARRAFHARAIILYFAAVGLLRAVFQLAGGVPAAVISGSLVLAVGAGIVAAGLSTFLGWLSARTTVFAITDRRVVLKAGMMVSSTINLPFRIIEQVQTRMYPDGTGDFVLVLSGSDRIAYLQLWPYARPWRLAHPQPMLRSVPDAARVAETLREALVAFNAPPAPPHEAARRERPTPVTVP